MIFFEVFRALWRMLERRRRVYLVILLGLLFTSGVFEMLGMMLIFGFIKGLHVDIVTGARHGIIGRFVEWLLQDRVNDLNYALFGGTCVLAVLMVKNAQSLLVRYHVTRFLANLNQRIGLQLFAALATLPYAEAIRGGLTSLERRLKGTLELLNVCFRHATQIIASAAVLATILALLAYIDAQLTALFVLLFGAFGITQNRLLERHLRRLAEQDRRALATAQGHISSAFRGLVEARLRDRIPYFQHQIGVSLGGRNLVHRKLAAWGRVPAAANEVLLVGAIVTAVLVMAARGSSIEHATPTFAAFGFAGMRAVGAIVAVNKAYQALLLRAQRFRSAMRDLARVAPRTLGSDDTAVPTYLAEERPLPEGRDGRLHRKLEIRRVSFRYPRTKRRALNNVSLKIKRGEFVAFCGPSGSGKSTLILTLIGLLKPASGDVRCDGWSIFEHIRAWQKSIGYVGQAAYLAATTVRENVAFGLASDEIDDDRVWRALELAAARSFVEELPQGLHSPLTDEGGGLSGGQRQRILIARALYHDPDVVIFDEATAALDNATEREITEAAVRLSGLKTVICVAHRLSTIEMSDKIFVLDKGVLVGEGTYAELLATSDVFRRLAQVATGPTSPPPAGDGHA